MKQENYQFEIVRSKRKTITLTVDNTCKLTVKAPLKMTLSDINKFISQKEKWISEKLSFFRALNEDNEGVILCRDLLYLGKKYAINFIKTKYIYMEEGQIFFPQSAQGAKFFNAVKRWYRVASEDYVCSRATIYAQIMGTPFTELKITDSKKRWGSCDSTGKVSFNLRVLALPPRIIDYVIVHELAHIKHLNHSVEFWSAVEENFPDYKSCRKELKQYNFVMNLFRK